MTVRNRDNQKLQTRRRIIEAAIRVFSRDGILASATADVAKEAELSHGSVFAHFGTQAALIAAVIEDFGEVLARRLHELVSSGAGTREVLQAHLDAIAESEDFYARLVVESSLLPAGARDSLISIQSAICFHLSSVIEAETESGALRVMPLHLLFNTWIGLIHHYLMNRELFAPGASVVERHGRELLDHFMYLISKGG
jgi:AcrR family transcriptional regulator